MRVLVVNAGSSSLKLRLLSATDAIERSADLPAGPDGFDTSRLTEIFSNGWPAPDVVGHRIVHGGTAFTGPVLITDAVRKQLQDLTDLAPLHQPKSLAALDAVTAQLPGETVGERVLQDRDGGQVNLPGDPQHDDDLARHPTTVF